MSPAYWHGAGLEPWALAQGLHTHTKAHPGLPAQQTVGSEPPSSCRIRTRVGAMMASSCPPPSWAKGPLGIRLGAHAAQPTPEADGRVGCWGGQSCSSDSDTGVGRGPHTIRRAHLLPGLPVGGRAGGYDKRTACMPTSLSPHGFSCKGVCVNSAPWPVPPRQVSLPLREVHASPDRGGLGSRHVGFAQPRRHRTFKRARASVSPSVKCGH